MHGKNLSYYEKFVKHIFCLKEHTRTILAPISHSVTGNWRFGGCDKGITK